MSYESFETVIIYSSFEFEFKFEFCIRLPFFWFCSINTEWRSTTFGEFMKAEHKNGAYEQWTAADNSTVSPSASSIKIQMKEMLCVQQSSTKWHNLLQFISNRLAQRNNKQKTYYREIVQLKTPHKGRIFWLASSINYCTGTAKIYNSSNWSENNLLHEFITKRTSVVSRA